MTDNGDEMDTYSIEFEANDGGSKMHNRYAVLWELKDFSDNTKKVIVANGFLRPQEAAKEVFRKYDIKSKCVVYMDLNGVKVEYDYNIGDFVPYGSINRVQLKASGAFNNSYTQQDLNCYYLALIAAKLAINEYACLADLEGDIALLKRIQDELEKADKRAVEAEEKC